MHAVTVDAEPDSVEEPQHLVRRSIGVVAAMLVVAVVALILIALLVAKGFAWLTDQTSTCDGCG